MAWYPRAGSYQKYLQNQSYIEDIGLEFKRESNNIVNSISNQTKEIVANNNQIAQVYANKLDKISHTLDRGFSSVTSAIVAFHASFNEKMEQVINRLDLINENLNKIVYALHNPQEMKVIEYYNRGCRHVIEGILDDAEEEFVEALRLDKSDFPTHLALGKLYLTGHDKATKTDVFNLEKANYHLLQASTKYGRGKLRSNPNSGDVVSVAFLYASRSFYVQIKSKDDMHLVEQAIELAIESTKINPNFSQAYLYLARYYEFSGQIEEMKSCLIKAIEIDNDYFFTIDEDETFNQRKDIIKQIQIEFRDKAHSKVKPKMLEAARQFENLTALNFTNSSHLNEYNLLVEKYNKANSLYKLNNFFGYRDCYDFINTNLL